MTLAAVVLDQLGKSYRPDAPPAVADLSLTIEAGEVYGLLGSNGSGKSTTVGILATLLAPSTGSARVLGHDVVSQAPQVRRRIGVTLQEAGVDAAATGRALLLLHGRLLGLPGRVAAERAEELLAVVDLTGAADRRLRTYSGGMRRRLDLALALVGRPDVILLDEPTTGLDPLSRQSLWAEVRRLRSDGAAILLTTQYLEEADQLADRVGILVAGRLRVEGPPAQLKRDIGGERLDVDVDPAQTERAAAAMGVDPTGPGRLVLQVDDGGAAIPRVLATLNEADVAVQAISLTSPTLDDVFLDVVGRRLGTPGMSTPEPDLSAV